MNNDHGKWAFYDYHICFSICTWAERLWCEYTIFRWFIQEITGFLLWSDHYLILWRTITERERFMITTHVFVFPLRMKDFTMQTKELSNLYKRSMVSSFCPVITYWYEEPLWKMRVLLLPYIFFFICTRVERL